jgi:hypothetical protein
VYAEVVGALSALTAILYFIPFILRYAVVWGWNLVLFILWIALFGVFGKVWTPSLFSLVPPSSVKTIQGADTIVHRCTSTKTPRATTTLGG